MFAECLFIRIGPRWHAEPSGKGIEVSQFCLQLPDGAGYIRTLVPQNFGGADGNLCVGTTNNVILEGSLQDKFTWIVQVRDQLNIMQGYRTDVSVVEFLKINLNYSII